MGLFPGLKSYLRVKCKDLALLGYTTITHHMPVSNIYDHLGIKGAFNAQHECDDYAACDGFEVFTTLSY